MTCPQPATTFHGPLLGEHLDALGVARRRRSSPGPPRRDAIARMKDDGLECLLVVDGDRLVGIVTYQDAILKLGRKRSRHRVERLMTPDPVVLRHDDTTAVALNKMAVGGSATSRSSRTAGRPGSSRRATCSATSSRSSGDPRLPRRPGRDPRRRPELGRPASPRSSGRRRRRRPASTGARFEGALTDADGAIVDLYVRGPDPSPRSRPQRRPGSR